jgi:hypothetical protein
MIIILPDFLSSANFFYSRGKKEQRICEQRGGGGILQVQSTGRIGTKVLRVFFLDIHSHLYDFTGDGVSNFLTCIGITICLLVHIVHIEIKKY